LQDNTGSSDGSKLLQNHLQKVAGKTRSSTQLKMEASAPKQQTPQQTPRGGGDESMVFDDIPF
jgi:hypothetical protein